jgi:hypothetical protein
MELFSPPPNFEGIRLHQITGDGLALELSVKGTRYYRNDELN